MPDGKMSIEKRANPRLAVKIPVKYQLVNDHGVIQGIEEWRKTENNAFTLDLSMGGMFIAVDKELKVGNIIKFEVFLFDKKNFLGVYAEVVRSDASGAGLHFLMMKSAERELLQAFLEKS